MAEAEDRIAGLEQGADDYLPKPFEPRELVLRIRTLLRRVPQETLPKVQEVRFGEPSFDLDRQPLRRGTDEVRSEERRVGKEGVRTCMSRWSPSHSKNKKK